MKVTKYLIAAVAVLTVCSARADEGMWLLQLMKQQNSIYRHDEETRTETCSR